METKLLEAERFINNKTGVTYRYVYSDTEYFRPHYHDYYEIFVMLEGAAMHYVNNSKIKLNIGDIVFVRPFDEHDYVGINGKKFSMLNISFTSLTAEMIFEFLGSGFPTEQLLEVKLPPQRTLSQNELGRLENKMSNIRATDPENFDEIKTKLRILIFNILTQYFSRTEKMQETVPYWLEKMCEQMSKNGNFKNDTEFFFSLSDKTREHISRSLKKYYNMTVTEFINSLRLNYIANMLRNSNHNITDIIYESGFNNVSWASELFKAKYGTTMRNFRKSM